MRNKEIAALYKTIADSFSALSEIYSSEDEQPKAKSKKEKPPKTDDSPKKDTPTEEESETTKTYTDVEVRAALAEKNKLENKKYSPQVKALVTKYSTDGTFSGIPEDKYTELITELEGIGNG
ncbi:MAG: hypothetical protein IJJ64_11305 [Butyrivibrio sp.]|nr:hypothetical protein [Butyrivibrio sp.]